MDKIKDTQAINRFFKPIECKLNISAEEYHNLQACIAMVDAASRTTNQSLYIIDYNKKNFLFVSNNPLFLCGYSPDEVKEMGYGFYLKVVPEEEIGMLMEINEAGFDWLYHHPKEIRLDLTIEYDFHLKNESSMPLMIHHQLTPILLNEEGDIWLALCNVSLSSATGHGNVTMNQRNSSAHYEYSFVTRRWKEVNNIALTERESDILRYSIKGLSNTEIGEKLFIDASTVKFHKRKIFDKLHTDNITEAINVAVCKKLI
ncbi:response regulator transcription factor [Bacteroides helcogenes]|uniref:Transcriptional regulator, LuxR family n=1 Tax=Bacteroides helcogenes (strain ATCC 35417 / DSM 20613 / JCM 6297 / CCUG 15421 / P 36-108) TaxID=693979 RepID=E6SWF4_BACT6|nr:helix-turn-helix transcriptional regulator [Bacteroides helcogenes]ADV44615.1 transcriptional regulator, LuxR family [Bacteroides helcogenes P 36-108]MDY5238906.1 helix-turn-helix transcriptional regulator [Bacteroides helcogenes]